MGCINKFARLILYVFNVVFALFSIALLAIGIAFILSIDEVTSALPKGFPAAPVLCIIAGGVGFVISVAGCCGAKRKSKCLLYIYAILLLIVLILELIAAGIALGFINSDDLQKDLLDALVKNGESLDFDAIQEQFECCGINGPGDYYPETPPESCSASKDDWSRGKYYQIGCLEGIEDALKPIAKVIGGVAIGFGVAEVVGIVLAVMLACSF